MDILNDEMHFEVLRHLELGQLLKISRVNKQYNGYLLDKNFWIIYLKYKTQAEYRRIVYKISKHGSVELFNILDTSFNNKVIELRMIGKMFRNASIYGNVPIIKQTEHRINRKFRDFILEKLIKKVRSKFTEESADEMCKYMQNYKIEFGYINVLWRLRTILINCHNYETLLGYLNIFGEDVHAFIDMDFIESLMSDKHKHAYDLFIGIIEAGIIHINDIKNETFVYECSDRRIFDYLIKKEFDYIDIKHPNNVGHKWPMCEYYVIKLYEEVINLYREKRCEDEYKFLWKLLISSFDVIEDQDKVIDMIEEVCKLKYSEEYLKELIQEADDMGHDYLIIKLKSIKL